MSCPRCGQQSSDGVRFCPRCGFHLAGLAAYMAANEHAPADEHAPRAAVMTARRRGNTAEIYQPPSVTENTTKLLDKDS